MAAQTPHWITLELFQNTLKTVFPDKDVELVTFTSKQAVADGENYTSDIFRTTLIYRDSQKDFPQTMSVIVKCGNEDGGAKTEMSEKLHLFEKEQEMYMRTLPAIYDIIGDPYSLSSKCYHSCTDLHSVVVLEDLSTLGFEVLPRHIGFDLEHCFLALEKMALMHAASVIMYEKDPSMVKCYKEGLYADNDMVRKWVGSAFKTLSEVCSKWPGFEKYGYKLQALGPEALERGLNAGCRTLGGFNVLNHGDPWVNNMMFSYRTDGRLDDMRFIDFQMNVFTSPAIDLHYFIATSLTLHVSNTSLDLILDHYYAQLLANLTKFRYSLEKVPTREQFKRDYNTRAFFGLMGAATVLPFVKASSRPDASMENVLKDDSIDGYRYHVYNNERYRKCMEFLLPYYDSFGILD